jgi:hypothetical protein
MLAYRRCVLCVALRVQQPKLRKHKVYLDDTPLAATFRDYVLQLALDGIWNNSFGTVQVLRKRSWGWRVTTPSMD